MIIFLMVTLCVQSVLTVGWFYTSLRCFGGEEGVFLFLFNVFCCSIVSALFSDLWNQRQAEISQAMVPFVFRGSVWYGGPESSPHRRLTRQICAQKYKTPSNSPKIQNISSHCIFSKFISLDGLFSH